MPHMKHRRWASTTTSSHSLPTPSTVYFTPKLFILDMTCRILIPSSSSPTKIRELLLEESKTRELLFEKSMRELLLDSRVGRFNRSCRDAQNAASKVSISAVASANRVSTHSRNFSSPGIARFSCTSLRPSWTFLRRARISGSVLLSLLMLS